MKKTLLLLAIVIIGALTFSACTSEQPEDISSQEQTILVTEKAVYDDYNKNLSKLMDNSDSSTPEKIDAITENAYELTADEWGYEIDELRLVIQREIARNNKLSK